MQIGRTIHRLSEEYDAARVRGDSEAMRGLQEEMLTEALRAIANGHTDPAGVAQLCLRTAYPYAKRPWEPTT